jgi:hypothetical protein
MSRARLRVWLLALLIVIGAGGLAYAFAQRQPARLPPRAPAHRPTLLLLTSLPLMFGEGFSIEGGGSPALQALETRYRVVPISVTNRTELSRGGLLLMAHPRAQPAEGLVALDEWVRNGGRVLLLADPMLEWPSDRPLGDPLRPPPMFMDTGLLDHWGLKLDAPDKRGLVLLGGGHDPVVFVSPGRLETHHSNCVLSRADIVADCKIGKGRAVVVADADFLNPEIATLRNPKIDNSVELMKLLDSLDR